METQAEIRSRVREALEIIPKEKLFLNPDCGFGAFAARPMNDLSHIRGKLTALTEAASGLREELG